MLRLALTTLAVVLAVLVALSLLPERQREIPDTAIHLEDAQVTLYPQADPEAVWYFDATSVSYQPNSRETTLFSIENGQRVVDEEIDFTLKSEQVTIDSQDNLHSEQMFVHLVEANWDLFMQGNGQQQVLIDQRRGKFEVPILDYTGDGLGSCNHAERVSMNFDLTDYRAGGEGTRSCNEFEDELLNENAT